MDLLQLCQWRYATKKMDSTRSVPAETVARILEVARLAPSSSGLQPYEIVLVSDPDLRRRIRAAANEGIDSTPMEGFDPAAVDEILGLRAKGLRSVLLLPLGYRDADNDWLLKLNKSRRPMGEFVTEIA
ncbi:MAG: nitroreductase family protein [Betaproteobacteria bacterium]|nr:nitroreductase family protein [Betaproteobacteria bacterium]